MKIESERASVASLFRMECLALLSVCACVFFRRSTMQIRCIRCFLLRSPIPDLFGFNMHEKWQCTGDNRRVATNGNGHLKRCY